MNKLPQARTSEIVVQNLKNELLVYDLTTHQAYTLNETLKIIYGACNGQTSFDELKRSFKFTYDLIHLALDQLSANDLLADYRSDHFAGLSRREAIKRVGFASMIALPVIASITAPTSASAASACTMDFDLNDQTGIEGSGGNCVCDAIVGAGNNCGRGDTGNKTITCKAGCKCVITECDRFCVGKCN